MRQRSKKEPQTNPKYVSLRDQPVSQSTNETKSFISAKTPNQRKYIKSIIENDITLCSGKSGTGKSLVALGVALEHIFREDKTQSKLYITRPMVATSTRDFPFIKGSLIEKLTPYFSPILNNLEMLLGSKKRLEDLLEREVINMQAIELMRGFTYKNSFVCITEAQNMTVPQAVMAVTRLGEGSKFVIEGDTDQKDIREYDGLSYLKTRIGYDPELCGYVQMSDTDIVRHPLISKILNTIDYRGASYRYDDKGVIE